MKTRKLIRDHMVLEKPKANIKIITDKDDLNRLFCLKIEEELIEIQNANFNDPVEFADLLQVVHDFAFHNGLDISTLDSIRYVKQQERGKFTNRVLHDLDINNPSNRVYFKQEL